MKKFQELTLKDNFMFSAVMMQGDNCKKLLEMILDIPISQVHIDYEKNIVYHPDYHGIRLDIIAKDEENTQYSVEMQVSHTPLTKRSRYYHSQIDSDLLLAGKGYDKLPDVYVIFICDYDPFGYGKYRYSQESYCPEAPQVDFDNGSYTIYLNTHGNNKEEVPEELAQFLDYVREGPKQRIVDENPHSYIQTLQDSIHQIKVDRTMEEKFMVLEEMLRQERKEGMEEGLQKGMEEGLQKGMEEGLQKGLEEGRTEQCRESIVSILESKEILSQETHKVLDSVDVLSVLNEIFTFSLCAKNEEEVDDFIKKCSK